MAYSYEDFLDKAGKSGLKDQFSQYDLDLAKRYPEFGISMLSLKQQWASASTPSAKALANEEANKLRARYGSYTGGSDGSLFIPLESSAPSSSHPSFSYDKAPGYENRYAAKQEALLDKVVNYEPFTYDPSSDPVYGAYMKQYIRQGQRSAADALAIGAASTGGIPSSHAQMAASQASDYYAGKASDIIPQLYSQAYERYLDEFSLRQAALEAINDREGIDYARFLDAYKQYSDSRDFAYESFMDSLSMDAAAQQAAGEKEQQRIDNALALWKLYGYATDEVAQVLGIEPGTPTADRKYDDWYSAYKSSSAGGKASAQESEQEEKSELTEDELRQLMAITGYAPDANGSGATASPAKREYTITNKHTDSWVAIGNARYTNKELLQLIVQGKVKEVVDKDNMTVTYVKK